MPTLAEGEARTIVVNPSGPPSNTLSVVLPPGVTISVESVLAAIDATGAGDTTALLEIADSSGAVIARKAQGQVVTGGVVGSATWALRLGDESAGGGGVTEVESLDGSVAVTNPFGPVVNLHVPGFNTAAEFVRADGILPGDGSYVAMTWAHVSGAHLLGYAVPATPTLLTSGVYAWSLSVQNDAAAARTGAFQAQFAIDLGHVTEEHWFQTSPNTSAVTGHPAGLIVAAVSLGVTRGLAGGRQMNLLAASGAGVGGDTCSMFGAIQRIY